MWDVRATLFGKFGIERKGLEVEPIRQRKAQELFSYLLIHRDHPQPRESLSELLWHDQPEAESRRRLRQTLWQVRSAFKQSRGSPAAQLLIDNNGIQINPSARLWLDTAELEYAFHAIEGKRTEALTRNDFRRIKYAVELYKGDFMEGWYSDWCLIERERFEIIYLILLDKLTAYCEIHRLYEAGLIYGTEILRHDRTYERAYRQMMRLFALLGNRTQALHQYGRCVAALRSELDVEPSNPTKRLYELIRSDSFGHQFSPAEKSTVEGAQPADQISAALDRLADFANELGQIQADVRKDIRALQAALSSNT